MKKGIAIFVLSASVALGLAQDSPPAKRIRVGGGVQQNMVVSRVAPVYPPLAKQARIQGVVRLEAHIGRDGKVMNLTVISGHPLLVQAALDAVRQWVYKPTLLYGEAVEVITTIDVNFTLSEGFTGSRLDPEAVDRGEQALRSNPEDVATRSRLLEHYAAAIREGDAGASLTQVRREHLLWLIEHHPEEGLLSAPDGMLFPAGFKLADPAGYEQAKRLWLNHTARSSDARVLRHAAVFLMIADKDLAETVLINAQAMQPAAAEWPSLRGKLYAEAILGLTVDPTGGATFAEPGRQSPLALRARRALDSTSDLQMLRSADLVFSRYGAEQLAADPQLASLVSRIKERLPPTPAPSFRVELPRGNP